ncbi:hypothetical protein GIB67_039998, partial [Kingdonia uniflora]
MDSVEARYKQMIILNVDGCCSQDRNALGGIFRLPNGIPIVAFNKPVLEDVGIGCVETKAICEGFKVAYRLGFKSFCVQADSEFAIKVLNGDYKQPWSCITDLRNVKNVISRMDDCLIMNKKREGNKPADYITSEMDIQEDYVF